MKRFYTATLLMVWLQIFWFAADTALSQERFFDNAEATSDQVRLTILYPSYGSLRALIELRNHGFIPIENLLVIGVYHEKEETDYQTAIDYVQELNLDWIKFHKLSGELNRRVLFQSNGCSKDFQEIFYKSDGIIFFGGADIPPYIYQIKTNLLTIIETPFRSFLETSFIFHLLGGFQDKTFVPLLASRPEFPILGICLGCQSLNVGTGGTLIQDIWSEKYGKKYLEDVIALGKNNWHTNPFASLYPEEKLISYNMHPIKLFKTGKLITELNFSENDRPYITSAHHQMVGKRGKGMKVIATSLDGKVVEAIEHETYPNVLGVQFHPEFTILWDRSRTYRFTPKDESEISLIEILEANPPSFEFHKKIWSWFGEKLKQYHDRKK